MEGATIRKEAAAAPTGSALARAAHKNASCHGQEKAKVPVQPSSGTADEFAGPPLLLSSGVETRK